MLFRACMYKETSLEDHFFDTQHFLFTEKPAGIIRPERSNYCLEKVVLKTEKCKLYSGHNLYNHPNLLQSGLKWTNLKTLMAQE